MTIHNFGYLVREGFRNMYKNRMMAIASIGVLMACLLLIGVAAMLLVNVDHLIGTVKDQNELVAFVDDGLEDADVEAIRDQLKITKNIRDFEYISQEQALEQEKDRLGDAAELLEWLEQDNPYPASFVIRVTDLSLLDDTVRELENVFGIYRVEAPTEVATALVEVQKFTTVISSGIILLLIAVSALIVINTIKITIFNRRREINIMKYVGATDRFIRTPFVIEGIVLGLISALLAFGILWGGYNYLQHWIAENSSVWISGLADSMVSFRSISVPILAAFVLAGIVIGGLGSGLFVRRHLRV